VSTAGTVLKSESVTVSNAGTVALGAVYLTNLLSDNSNCGTCGTVCTTGLSCSNGACVDLCANLVIDDGNVCTDDSCSNGTVTHRANSAACSPGTGYRDLDGDGYGAGSLVQIPGVCNAGLCASPSGYSPRGDDCDDLNKSVYPGNGCTAAVATRYDVQLTAPAVAHPLNGPGR
jgi:hypothetical protein